LEDQPHFAYFNNTQRKFIVASNEDILFVDMDKKIEIDLDEREEIEDIKSCLGDDSLFYILANKRYSRLGFFLLSFDLNDYGKECNYLISWSNKLDIDDCGIHMMHEKTIKEVNGQKIEQI
jgi:hypothetical protein